VVLAAVTGISSLGACGGSSSNGGGSGSVCSGGGPGSCGATASRAGVSWSTATVSGGGLLQNFTPPCDPGGGKILLTASGELLALAGYPFPPGPDDVAFVDGWEFMFDKVLVTFDHVKLWQNPDLVPTDQSKTGALFAQVDGPWAVDLHRGGPLPGKGGSGEQAVPIAAISCDFDQTQPYAFGFDAIAATTSAKNVNLDLSSTTTSDYIDYKEMIDNGYAVFYIGTATWKGNTAGASCQQADSGSATPYDFTKLPQQVKFRIGFATPTSYVNCQNPDRGSPGLNGEENVRGIQVIPNASTIAQVTFHTDHPFWDSFTHESPLHFDQVAAQFVGALGVPTVTLNQSPQTTTGNPLVGLNFKALTDAAGQVLPWRWCTGPNGPPQYPLYSTSAPQMSFDNQTVPFTLNGSNPAAALRDYRDFVSYDQSTQGHLNADGLCFVKRNYPSPP
jgi:hypothetical protein